MSKKNLNIPVAVCVFMITLMGQAAAVTHYVSPGQSIQVAIDDANNGDEIEVAPGTYNEAIDFNNKAVRLYSSGGPAVTIIDANGLNSSVVTCNSGEYTNTILEGFTVTGGDTFYGGGMYNYQSSPIVTNCTFTGNTAGYGGGMYNYDNSPMVTNCTFSGNQADYYGGGMDNWESSPTVTNCTFSGNQAGFYGGGMNNYSYSSSTVTNCTFSGNQAGIYGGGMFNYVSNTTVTSCILWGDTPDEIYNDSSTPTVTYSDVQGGCQGDGNINADPQFQDADGIDNIPGTADDNLRLSSGSACIDAGDTTAMVGISLDLDGNPRGVDDPQTPDTGVSVAGVIVDMGAYEFQPCPIDGDINCDGVVDFKDLAVLCNNWLAGIEP